MITIEQIVVDSNPAAADEFLAKYGVPSATDRNDFMQKINYVLTTNKDTAFAEIAAIPTPYRDLIMQFNQKKGCGCGGKCGGEGKSNCGGKCGKSRVDGTSTGSATDTPTPDIKKDFKNLADSTGIMLKETSDKVAPIAPLLTIALLAGIFVFVAVK